MITYDEAIHRVIDTVKVLPPVEETIENALGRVLAAPVRARWTVPPADNSAMDGFAMKGEELTAGSELQVVGFVPAGRPFSQAVSDGEAVRIMTGAPIPAGCDTVVPMEEAEVESDRIQLRKTPRLGQHIRRKGEEFEEGEPLLSPGTPLYAGEIALLATAGIASVQVYPRPRVALLATGDELVELGAPPGPGQIINSNTYLLTARLREEGCHVLPLGIARDNEQDLGVKIAAGLRLDVLITTGGVSVGDRDLVQDALRQHGFSQIFWKVKIKPGKPVLFGTCGDTTVFG
ncbi:MAG TPA: molybdopterin molybdenumtransferase MoeA, partial [Geoalkalibacter subterraneus]|nr:molybdopterin molybdenumtransferase MoeA [Geoalkalibacter subterraneus]